MTVVRQTVLHYQGSNAYALEILGKSETLLFDTYRSITSTGEDNYSLTRSSLLVSFVEVEYCLRCIFEVSLFGAPLIFCLLIRVRSLLVASASRR